jgi:hypothetical protein
VNPIPDFFFERGIIGSKRDINGAIHNDNNLLDNRLVSRLLRYDDPFILRDSCARLLG